MKAFQIAIEGSDGAGKGTQTNLLVGALEAQGYKVARVSFPRYTETVGGKICFELLNSQRADDYDFVHLSPKAASLFYAADRLESIPWLEQLAEENDVIIYDRAVASNLIHQGGKFENDSERMEFAAFINRVEYESGFPQPDMTLFLSLPYELSMARARRRAEEKGESADVVEKEVQYMRNSYRSGVFYSIYLKWTIVDGIQHNEILTPEQVHVILLSEVIKRLPKK